MGIETARSFFLWCSLINYGFLLIWVAFAIFGQGSFYRLVGRMFPLTLEQFNLINYGGIALYKAGIFLLNIAPCIALYIIK